MSATALRCCVCNKDLSSIKHVKDILDNYYCEPCHLKGIKEAATTKPAARSAPVIPAQKAPSAPAGRQPAAARAATIAPAAAAASTKLPEFCPNCDTPVIGNRKLCVRCHRDVTQMAHITARKNAAPASSGLEAAASWFGTLARIAGVLVCLGILAFIGVGLWMMFRPVNAFEDYPTTRRQAISSFLADIAQGTDKGYNKAFLLVSFRERTTNNPQEDQIYKAVYAHIHDDFAAKYGADWPAKAVIENPDPANTEDTIPYTVTLGKDHYHITTQAQITIEQATANLTIRRDTPHYPEDGKRRFGIVELLEYPVHERSTMIERAGPGRPEPLPDAQDFRNLRP